MPTVPRYDGQVIRTAPIPGVRKTAAETDISTGAGVERARAAQFGALANLGGTIATGAIAIAQTRDKAADAERDRQDDLVALSASERLGKWEVDRINDPRTGALTVKGADALKLPDTVTKEFNTVADEIEKSLTSDRQREAFARIRAQRGLSIHTTVARHVSEQMEAFEKQTVEATEQTGVALAIANSSDPRRVAEELQRIEGAATAYGKRQGVAPEAIAAHVADLRTAVHTGVITRLLDNNRPADARDYYEEVQGQINGDARGDLEKRLNAGSDQAEAQRVADEIISQGGTLTEQRARLRERFKNDPNKADVRAAAEQRLSTEAAIQQAEKRDKEESMLTDAFAAIRSSGGRISSIPPSAQYALSQHMPALEDYARKVAKGEPVVSDLNVFYDMVQQASTDPATFATLNLRPLMAKLDEGDFKQLLNWQADIRAKKPEVHATLDGIRTDTQIFNETLDQYRIPYDNNASADQKDTAATIHRLWDRRIDELQAGGTKKLTNLQKQAELDAILAMRAKVPGTLWGTNEKRLIDVTIDDLESGRRLMLEQALRTMRRPVTDSTILELHMRLAAEGK